MPFSKWCALGLVCLSAQIYAALAVIVNAGAPVQSLTSQQLANLYLGNNSQPTGFELTPIDQDSNTPAFRDFYQSILHWTPDQVSGYWTQREFTGESDAPLQFSSPQAIVSYVAKNKHAVAYVNPNAVGLRGVRVVWHQDQLDSASLWTIMEQGFQLAAVAQAHPRRLQTSYQFWKQQPGLVQAFVGAHAVLPYVVTLVQQHHLPMELALLPMMESHYRLTAVSRADARGLWQLMPDTAKALGVTINPWFDGRLDVVMSTRAALSLLSALYQRYHSWPLALAAYDAGTQVVDAAIALNHERGLKTDYWDLVLPKETEAYVPDLLALAQWLETQKTLPPMSMQPKFVVYRLHHQIPITALAKLAQQSVQAFKQLNAGLLRSVTPNTPVDVYVPISRKSLFAAGITAADNTGKLWRLYHARHLSLAEMIAATDNSADELRHWNPSWSGSGGFNGWFVYQYKPALVAAQQHQQQQDKAMLMKLDGFHYQPGRRITSKDSLKTLLTKVYHADKD